MMSIFIVIFLIVAGLQYMSVVDFLIYLPEMLVVVLLWLYWVFFKNTRKYKKPVTIVIISLVLVRADFLISWLDMKIKCTFTSDVEVYSTVAIGSEYFDNDGWPVYLDKERPGVFKEDVFNGKYSVKKESDIPVLGAIRRRLYLVDTNTGEMMSKVDLYKSQGGWYRRYLKKGGSFHYCGTYHSRIKLTYVGGDYDNKENILHSVFVKSNG